MAAGLPGSLVGWRFSARLIDTNESLFLLRTGARPLWIGPWLVLSMDCGSNRHWIPGSNTEGECWEHFPLSFSMNPLSSAAKHLSFLSFSSIYPSFLSPSYLYISPVISTLFHYSLSFLSCMSLSLSPFALFLSSATSPYLIFFSVWVCPHKSPNFSVFPSSSTLVPHPFEHSSEMFLLIISRQHTGHHSNKNSQGSQQKRCTLIKQKHHPDEGLCSVDFPASSSLGKCIYFLFCVGR